VLHEVFHFSFTVSDIDASVRWYRDVLGLELVHRQRQDNDYTRTLVGLPEAVLEVAQFRLPHGSPPMSTHMLELVEYVKAAGDRVPLSTNNVGVAHLALVVTEVHDEYERLRSLGVEFRNPPVEITAGVNRGGYSCYCSDPDGITIELLEPARDRQRRYGILVGSRT
jgi:catechol 2,3-dioxygenase-like lactoylglutathione lyase family enzyme